MSLPVSIPVRPRARPWYPGISATSPREAQTHKQTRRSLTSFSYGELFTPIHSRDLQTNPHWIWTTRNSDGDSTPHSPKSHPKTIRGVKPKTPPVREAKLLKIRRPKRTERHKKPQFDSMQPRAKNYSRLLAPARPAATACPLPAAPLRAPLSPCGALGRNNHPPRTGHTCPLYHG